MNLKLLLAGLLLFLSAELLAQGWTTSFCNIREDLLALLHLRGLGNLILKELLALLELGNLLKDAFLCSGVGAHHHALVLHCLLFQISQVFVDSLLVKRVGSRACCIVEGWRKGSCRLERLSCDSSGWQGAHRVHELLKGAVWHVETLGVRTLCLIPGVRLSHLENRRVLIDIVYLLIELIFALLALLLALSLGKLIDRARAIGTGEIQVLVAANRAFVEHVD